MLPSNPHVQQVYGGPDGVFAGMRKGALLIDCSTIDPNVARAVGGQAAIKTVRVCVCVHTTARCRRERWRGCVATCWLCVVSA